MKNLKISAKLTVSFVIVNAIYILGIIALLLSYMMSNDRLNNMNNTAVTPQIAIGDLRESIQRQRAAAFQLVLLEPGTEGYTSAIAVYEAEGKVALNAIGAYRAASDEAGQSIADAIESYYKNEYSAYMSAIVALSQNDSDDADIEKIAASTDIEARMDAQLDSAASHIGSRIAFFIENARFGLVRLVIIVVVVIAFIALLISYIIRYMQRTISRKIEHLTGAANLLAAGHLSMDISSDSTDEIGMLTDAFVSMADSIKEQARVLGAVSEGDLTVDIAPRSGDDAMNMAIKQVVDNLNHMFGQISASTSQVSIGARSIAQGAQTLAQGTTQQASTVEVLAGSIAQVAHTTRDSAAMARQAAELMGAVNGNATRGSLQMDRMAQAVQEISAASQSISRVMKVIDDIAFQTNILSLNAAVEAARAGVHGRGFAVVAEEVRSLATKSAQAARDTGTLIENSIEKAMLGAHIAQETVASFEQIVAGIGESTHLLNDIARTSEQQSTAIARIDEGIGQVAQVVQQNSATAQQSAASSQELRSQSELLEGLISRFETKAAHSIHLLPRA